MIRPSLRDGDVRRAVRASLSAQHQVVAEETMPLLLDELVIGEHGRIDLALVTESTHGFELKSDHDSLTRLPRQMHTYSRIFDFCTLVVTPRHLAAARARLRRGWGLSVVEVTAGGEVRYSPIRSARPNRAVRAEELVQLLWRAEALAALEAVGAATGYRSKPRTDLWDRLCEVIALDELKTIVRTALRERRGWRDGTRRHASDAKLRPEDMSSRFLARRVRAPQR
ncbi:sce7726 family protein [Sciscionella marina]|uniref:sce7726 family protein n=1 Tax=Sciscionella marina TaxID=508770 RepID=UPI003B8319BC